MRQRQIEAVAEGKQLLQIHFLGLVRDVLRFGRTTHRPTLDGVHQNQRRRAAFLRGLVRGIDLERVVAAALQRPDFLVGHVGNQRLQFERVEEMLADVSAVLGFVRLIVAVVHFHHAFAQHAIDVAGEQFVPLTVPHDFDDVPTGAAEFAFQLLHNLAAAAYRAVEALQVTVHHEDQIVQMLARSQGDLPAGFRLVHLAVAEERPDLAPGILDKTAAFHITHEARLIERHHRAETHGNRRELPEMRHQPRVRVRRQAVAAHFLPIIIELLLGQTAFEEGAGVHSRRAVSLEEDQIAALLAVLTVPEVVLPDFIHDGG